MKKIPRDATWDFQAGNYRAGFSGWRPCVSRAMEYYTMTAEEIGTELVYLKTGRIKPCTFFGKQLGGIREMVPREFATMNASYEYGDFPAVVKGVSEV